jgi:hypothetical protein
MADAGPMVDMGTAALGEPCIESANCLSGFCLQLEDDGGVCSQDCVDTPCPEGWFCAEVPHEMTRWCVPDDRCVDFDRDGSGQGAACALQDCNDGDGDVHQGVTDICDHIDNDCDEAIDEDFAGEGDDCDTGVPGRCSPGWQTCEIGEVRCIQREEAIEETCNRIDDDCDGAIDEAIERSCGTDVGACEFGVETCSGGQWNLCRDSVEGTREICNDIDDDCDGITDDVAAVPDGVLRIEGWGHDSYLGASADGRQYAIVKFEDDGSDLLLKIIDAEQNSVVQTSSALAWVRVNRGSQPSLDYAMVRHIGGEWWVFYTVKYRGIRFEGDTNRELHQASILRFNAAGEPIGDFVSVADQSRIAEVDIIGERIGVMTEGTVHEYGIDGSLVRRFEAPCVVDRQRCNYIAMGATPEGWMFAMNFEGGDRRPWRTITEYWVDGERVGERFESLHEVGTDTDRLYLTRTEDGLRLVTAVHTTQPWTDFWQIAPVDDEGRLGETTSILEEPRLIHGRSPDPRAFRSHGRTGGLFFMETIQHPRVFGQNHLYFYSRTTLDGQLFLTRELFIGDNLEDPEPVLGNFQTAGIGSEVGIIWSVNRDLFFARSQLSACMPPAP